MVISLFCLSFSITDLIQAFSQHTELSSLFLAHLICALDQSPVLRGDLEKAESSSHFAETKLEDDILQAAIFAMTAFFRSPLINL